MIRNNDDPNLEFPIMHDDEDVMLDQPLDTLMFEDVPDASEEHTRPNRPRDTVLLFPSPMATASEFAKRRGYSILDVPLVHLYKLILYTKIPVYVTFNSDIHLLVRISQDVFWINTCDFKSYPSACRQ